MSFRPTSLVALALAATALLAAGCSSDSTTTAANDDAASSDNPACPPGAQVDSLALPDGFCAQIFHEGVGPARHLTVTSSGDVYVKLSSVEGGGVVALRDTDGDGRADRTERFADFGGTGIEVDGDYLYASSDVAVMRWPLPTGDALVPSGSPETIVDGFPEQGQHAAKSLALGPDGQLFVNVGAPSNACQQSSRQQGSPGQEPCPQLREHGGVWQYDAGQTGQTHQSSARYATGIRNAVALDWSGDTGGALHVMQHGRDQLRSLWPDLYTEEESAELPSEEFFAVSEGDDFGWPYCYHDWQQEQKELAPEYGGDGEEVGRCSAIEGPIEAFPGHWAPNDLLFYSGGSPEDSTQAAFPQEYQGGAFVAFHGSWNRAPFPQQGYRVAFVPFAGGQAGDYTTFANNFARKDSLRSPGNAAYRPMGLAEGPDGALYISDSVEGRIWRVSHTG